MIIFFLYSFALSRVSPARAHVEAEPSVKDLKKEVEQHLKEKQKLEQTLPSSIVIGPFFVRVEAVRSKLANKKKAMAKALLEHIVEKLRVRIEDVSLCRFTSTAHDAERVTRDVFKRDFSLSCISVLGVQACETCANMNKRLREVPNSIEELSDKRDWMKQIPELTRNYRVCSRDLRTFKKCCTQYLSDNQIKIILFVLNGPQEELNKTLADYDLLDDFNYILSDEDMSKK